MKYSLLLLQIGFYYCSTDAFLPRKRIRYVVKRMAVDLDEMEQQFRASAQANMDSQTIIDWLKKEESNNSMVLSEQDRLPTNQNAIALAAALVATTASWFLFKLPLVSLFVATVVYIAALRSPLDSQDDDVAGAIARILGRATIQTVEISSKKARTIAKALVDGEEELVAMRQKIKSLEGENEQLRLYKRRREFVDENLPNYTLGSLQDYARINNLPVGGTKPQLLMRLVEADVIEMDE